jgi:hypothetical protein
MKTKNYLRVNVKRNDGSYFLNPLKLSEAMLINKLVKDNESVWVTLMTVSTDEYKSIFG